MKSRPVRVTRARGREARRRDVFATDVRLRGGPAGSRWHGSRATHRQLSKPGDGESGCRESAGCVRVASCKQNWRCPRLARRGRWLVDPFAQWDGWGFMMRCDHTRSTWEAWSVRLCRRGSSTRGTARTFWKMWSRARHRQVCTCTCWCQHATAKGSMCWVRRYWRVLTHRKLLKIWKIDKNLFSSSFYLRILQTLPRGYPVG